MKLGAFPGFELPDLDHVVGGVEAVARAERVLDATYFDTADLRLARWGITVRHRSGDGGGWTVKLPDGDDGPALVRRELRFIGGPRSVPDAAVGMVRAYARRAALEPVARLRTRRSGVELRGPEGERVAEVVDDEVSVREGRRVAARFREVEMEVEAKAPEGLLDAVLARLREAGAGAVDPTPKVMRALGARATEAPDLVGVTLAPDSSMADVIRASLVGATMRIMRHDPGVRIGDDPEDVHQARVGARRLRSDLRTYRDLLEREWHDEVRDELQWLGEELGAVRDTDVLMERLRRQAGELPDRDAMSISSLLRRLARQRDQARTRVLRVLEEERYVHLLDRLVAAAATPPVLPEADRPAAEVLPRLVGAQFRKLKKAIESSGSSPDDEHLHEVRKRAKRARYAGEAAAPVVGKAAARFAKAVEELQSVLGDHQDAVVTEEWLRKAVGRSGAAPALAAGELISLQRADASRGRKVWRSAWKAVDRTKRIAWLG